MIDIIHQHQLVAGLCQFLPWPLISHATNLEKTEMAKWLSPLHYGFEWNQAVSFHLFSLSKGTEFKKRRGIDRMYSSAAVQVQHGI